jgi:ribose transport system ATP-binding protein
LESGFLFGAIFVGIANQDGVPIGSGFVFDRFDDRGKEKISDIGNNDANGSGLVSAQGTSGAIGCVSMTMDGGQDALTGGRSNIFGAVESSGNRCDAEIQLLGEIVQSHGKRGTTGEGNRRLDNSFARIITRCKVLHFIPQTAVRGGPGRNLALGGITLLSPNLCSFYVGSSPLDPMVAPIEQTEVPKQLALQMRGISKSFGPTPVLKKVDFNLFPGEIHALMGENGAGKSTLMKIAAGLIDQFEGEIYVAGKQHRMASPRDATRAGIAMIQQELSLVPELAVDENIFLGQEKIRSLFMVDREQQVRAAREVLRPLDFQGRIDQPIAKLRVGEQQLVEIAKALVAKARILIMDEPTSALSIHETERLFQVIRNLAKEGVAIVYISHRMEEVVALADTVTVLRDGRLIGSMSQEKASRREIIRMMVGRELQEVFASGKSETATRKPVLEVRNLRLENPAPTVARSMLVQNVNFSVVAGEVFGIAGLLGAGRTETLEVLFGLHPGSSAGEIRIEGKKIRLLNPVDAKAAGIALVTEDRKRDGLVLGAGIDRNAELAVLRTIASFGLVSANGELELADRTIRNLGIQANGPRQLAGTLSGGNQQKLVIGKWLLTMPRVLLLDEPTRGIDVGAKAEIYRLIGTLAEQGLAIVLVSSELPELTLLSDRILVLCEGRPTALLGREQFSHETILEYASPGGSVQPAFAEVEVAR